MNKPTAAILVATLATLAACKLVAPGTDSGASDVTGKDGTSGGAGAGAASDGGAAGKTGGSSGGSSTSGGVTTETVKMGQVMLTQSVMEIADNEYASYSAMAIFMQTTTAVATTPGASACTTSTDGDCTISACDASGVQSGDGGIISDGGTGPSKAPNAGDITIGADAQLTLSADGNTGSYAPKTGQTSLWSDGADITVDAKGADVPAFNTTLSGPGAVALTSPSWPGPGESLAIDRSQDMVFSWDNGGSGDVQVMISTVAGSKTATLTCKFKAADGGGTISAATMGKLVPTSTGSISVSAVSSTVVNAGDWKVTVSATSPASNDSGMPASGLANVQ
jgi:hypothetical protein